MQIHYTLPKGLELATDIASIPDKPVQQDISNSKYFPSIDSQTYCTHSSLPIKLSEDGVKY